MAVYQIPVINSVLKDKMGNSSICVNCRLILLITNVFQNYFTKKLMLEQFFDPLQDGFTSGKGCQ